MPVDFLTPEQTRRYGQLQWRAGTGGNSPNISFWTTKTERRSPRTAVLTIDWDMPFSFVPFVFSEHFRPIQQMFPELWRST